MKTFDGYSLSIYREDLSLLALGTSCKLNSEIKA